MQFFKVLLFTFLLFSTLNGATKAQLNKEYETLKSEYLKSVLNGNKQTEIKSLEKLISVGGQIKVDTTKYKSELARLKKTQPAKKPTQVTKKPPAKKAVSKPKNTTSSKWTITSVKTLQNSIIIDFNHNITKKHIKFSELKTTTKFRDVFEISGSFEDAYETKLEIVGVEKVFINQQNPKTLKISIVHPTNLKTIYIVNKRQIVIKVLNANIKTSFKKAVVKPTPKTIKSKTTTTQVASSRSKSQNRKKIIVIDPGHGGKDSGAVGKNKKYEKTAVLSVSKYLFNILKDRGYTVYLTRSTDKFIELEKRTKFSNDKKADIFVSIHANAIDRSKASKLQGIETFFLSPARSERAKRVAALENKGDMNAMNMDSQMSFLTILNQSKITESNKLAIDIQQHLLYNARQMYKDIVDGGVREGPFWVLVGAQMPSVLVELGYISHPTEGIRLFNTSYQKKQAEGIANGIESYFIKNPH